MVWLHSVRKVSTKLAASPFTETFIDGVHSVVYEPGITPIAYTGAQGSEGDEGEFGRGVHRISGMMFSVDGSEAEAGHGMGAKPRKQIIGGTRPG